MNTPTGTLLKKTPGTLSSKKMIQSTEGMFCIVAVRVSGMSEVASPKGDTHWNSSIRSYDAPAIQNTASWWNTIIAVSFDLPNVLGWKHSDKKEQESNNKWARLPGFHHLRQRTTESVGRNNLSLDHCHEQKPFKKNNIPVNLSQEMISAATIWYWGWKIVTYVMEQRSRECWPPGDVDEWIIESKTNVPMHYAARTSIQQLLISRSLDNSARSILDLDE